jgi:hypothetical protein
MASMPQAEKKRQEKAPQADVGAMHMQLSCGACHALSLTVHCALRCSASHASGEVHLLSSVALHAALCVEEHAIV